jgi:hypothetical protein
MAKQAARSGIRVRKAVAAPGSAVASGTSANVVTKMEIDRVTARLVERPRKASAPVAGDPATEAAGHSTDDGLGEILTAFFKKAVESAIQESLDAGLAVPGRENGKPVERRPNGKIVEIKDPANWSPHDWKNRP